MSKAALQDEIAAIEAKAAGDIARIKREAGIKAELTEALGLTFENFRPGSFTCAYGDLWIEYKAETLPLAIELAERMNPLGLFRFKDSCTSFRTDRTLKPKELERIEAGTAELESVGGYVYKLERFQNERSLIFYIEAAGHLVECRVRVASDPLSGFYDKPGRYDSRGRQLEPPQVMIRNESGYFRRVTRWWSSEPQFASATLWS